jgi:tRNA threonylcarbamoyladenosine biosynthesis protein TsaE
VHADPPLIGIANLATESVTERAGRLLAEALRPGDMVFLEGELGAGKSTMARAILGALGWSGAVRSPSYSLVHSYTTPRGVVHHLDLYRIETLDEALGLDLDELSGGDSIGLVEWPDRLGGAIPATWRASLKVLDEGRELELRGPLGSGFESILAHLNQENVS